MDIFKGIRPLDYVLTAVMVALATVIGLENVNAGADADLAHSLDSHSALMIPVFVIAALPILWRRRNILAAIGVSFVVVAASVPAFGWVTRCGFALPLSIAMAYAVARFAGSKQNHLIGLVGILALQIKRQLARHHEQASLDVSRQHQTLARIDRAPRHGAERAEHGVGGDRRMT